MFHRIGEAAFKPDLSNTLKLCEGLGNPQQKFTSIHVAGTNGKGSTSHMLAAVLQKSGYKTGLYTSPHLKDFRERIRINGKMISPSYIRRFVQDNLGRIEEIQPSFFEMTVALAFQYFAENQVDIAVIETGLGGRLDSTNVITPLLSVITNISLDHTSILGNHIEQIAFEKAGIIKPGVPVVIGEFQPEVSFIFTETAKSNKSTLIFASEQWTSGKRKPGNSSQKIVLSGKDGKSQAYKLDLPGSYQLKNLKTVLSALAVLKETGYKIHSEVEALSEVKKLTGLQGRWYMLSKNPLVICDTGHNAEGIREVVRQIEDTVYENLHMVIGVVKDKDLGPMLDLLPKKASYYFCKADIPRALDEDSLKERAVALGLKGNAYPSVKAALEAAKKVAKKEDLIFVGGSTFVVAEIIP